MKLAGIIVNYRTAKVTVRSVAALLPHLEAFGNARLVLVDNDSRDGSFDYLSRAIAERGWSNRVTLVASDHNGGFGYGVNFGMRHLLAREERPEYFYVLNSDAFPDDGAVRSLVEYLDANPDVGVAGSYIHGMKGERHVAGFRFPTVISEFESTFRLGIVSRLFERWIVALPHANAAFEVDWVSGASMMLRRACIEHVGMFDEGFFLYFEETDLCRRVRDAGWKVAFVGMSTIGHIGSLSTGFSDMSRRMPRYWFASRRRYFEKHHGAAYLTACDIAWTVGFAAWRVRARLQRKPDTDRPHMLSDFVRYNFAQTFRLKMEPEPRPQAPAANTPAQAPARGANAC